MMGFHANPMAAIMDEYEQVSRGFSYKVQVVEVN